MATGSQMYSSPQSKGYILLDAETSAPANGVWVDVGDLMELALHVDVGTSATVEIHGSCANARPSDATDGVVIGTVTTDSLSLVVPSPRWLKCKLTAVSGACSAWVVGRKPTR